MGNVLTALADFWTALADFSMALADLMQAALFIVGLMVLAWLLMLLARWQTHEADGPLCPGCHRELKPHQATQGSADGIIAYTCGCCTVSEWDLWSMPPALYRWQKPGEPLVVEIKAYRMPPGEG